jgi:hypothetical protein
MRSPGVSLRAPAFTQKEEEKPRTLTDLLFEIHAFVRVCPCGPWLNFFGSIESLRVIKAPRRLSHKKV